MTSSSVLRTVWQVHLSSRRKYKASATNTTTMDCCEWGLCTWVVSRNSVMLRSVVNLSIICWRSCFVRIRPSRRHILWPYTFNIMHYYTTCLQHGAYYYCYCHYYYYYYFFFFLDPQYYYYFCLKCIIIIIIIIIRFVKRQNVKRLPWR